MTGERDEPDGIADRWRFDALFNDPVSFIGELAPDGTVRRVNPTALAFAETAASAVVGEHFAETPWWRHSKPERDRLRDRIERAAAGEFVRFEAGNAGAGDADRVRLDVSLVPVTDDDGDVVAILVQGRDVTGRVAAREELETRSARMKALHDAAVGLESADTETDACEHAVRAAEDVLELYLCYVGLVEDNRIEPSARSSRATDEHVRTMQTDEGLAGRTLRTGESQLVHDITDAADVAPTKDDYRSGLSVPVGDLGVFQAVSTDPEGFDESDLELAETLAAHLAVTLQRIRTERQLRRQNERLDQFASVVAHDLRNPLAVISGSLDLALEDAATNAKTDDDGEAEGVEHLVRARRATERMEELLADLLELSRAGEGVGSTEPVALQAVAERAWQHVAHDDATLHVDVSVDADATSLQDGSVGPAASVEADRARVTELFENLFRNAVEHASPDVAVTVGWLDDGTGFYVADDGPGIAEEARERVFDSGYSTAADGTGFGLAIVRDIAQAHGWTITVGESVDGGARFEIRGVDARND